MIIYHKLLYFNKQDQLINDFLASMLLFLIFQNIFYLLIINKFYKQVLNFQHLKQVKIWLFYLKLNLMLIPNNSF